MENGTEKLIILTENDDFREGADELARQLKLRVTTDKQEAQEVGLMLLLDEKGLTLTDGELAMRGDLTKMLPRLKRNNLLREMIVKAAKIRDTDHQLTAVDMTAGMGEDSLLLAAAGFQVQLFEYNPVIAALLADALSRAAHLPELADIVSRMQLHAGDSIEGVQTLGYEPDVIVLDPMFPERQKSAFVKKKFQLLQQLESPCSDEEDLVRAAVAAHPHKIVIKRPLKGPYLAGMKPAYSLSGKAIRYDCLVFA